MAAIVTSSKTPAPAARTGASFAKTVLWLPLIALAAFIVIPQLAMVAYAFFDSAGFTTAGVETLFANPAFYAALTKSVTIALVTVVVLVASLVPAVVAVHLWAPKLSGALSIMCTLPLVIPAIALVAGLLQVLRTMSGSGRGTPLHSLSMTLQSHDFPIALIGTYVVLCLPFTYRSINAALTTIPLRTFFEASSGLGASTIRTLWTIVIPNIRGSIMFSAFFAFALAFGEYTVAATMSVPTLPVFMTTLSATNFRASIALSVLSNLLTWTLLAVAMLLAERAGRHSRPAKSSRRFSKKRPGSPTQRTTASSQDSATEDAIAPVSDLAATVAVPVTTSAKDYS